MAFLHVFMPHDYEARTPLFLLEETGAENLLSPVLFVSLSFSCSPPCFFFFFFFFHPPVPLARSLILSGFIARECQAFETVFKPLLQKRFLGKKAKKAMNNLLKTTPFVWWE
jgi:hypothetical protein